VDKPSALKGGKGKVKKNPPPTIEKSNVFGEEGPRPIRSPPPQRGEGLGEMTEKEVGRRVTGE